MEFSDRKWEKRCLQAEERIKDLEKQNNELLIQQNDLKTDVNRWKAIAIRKGKT